MMLTKPPAAKKTAAVTHQRLLRAILRAAADRDAEAMVAALEKARVHLGMEPFDLNKSHPNRTEQ